MKIFGVVVAAGLSLAIVVGGVAGVMLLSSPALAQRSLTPGAVTDSSQAKAVLAHVRKSLTKQKDENPEYLWFHYFGDDCIKELKMPAEFAKLKKVAEKTFAKKDYLACADAAERMAALIPAKLPTGYPFMEDFHSEWLSHVGDMRMLGNDYKGALRCYTQALQADLPKAQVGSRPRMMFSQLGGHQSAAYGRAQVYALLGNRKEALKDLADAPGYYWSGCGNCMESEGHMHDRLEKIYSAATLPPKDAEVALLKLAAGGYKALKGRINGDQSAEERRYAQSDATLFLGELYLKQQKHDLAILAFDALAVEDTTENAKMAKSRLRSLR